MRRHGAILLCLSIFGALGALSQGALDDTCDKIVPHRWEGSPGAHQYLQTVELANKGRGRLVYGDSQVIRHDEKIRFRLHAQSLSLENSWMSFGLQEPPQRYLLEFDSVEPEYGRHYSGVFVSQVGRYEIEEEYTGRKLVFRQRLRFEKCPFGYFEDKDYYGYPEKTP